MKPLAIDLFCGLLQAEVVLCATKKPLAIDLFAGLGGWTEGLLAEGYRVVGFDVERHVYGDAKYPAQLVLQDVLTIHGSQFKDAALIVASPPCQEFSYMAMPWIRAKQIRAALLGQGEFPEGYRGSRTKAELTALFDACFRIQQEASQAAGHHIPIVVENVRGANEWVGWSRWNFGSFHLWGDVPALMPITKKHIKVSSMGAGWYPPGHKRHKAGLSFNGHAQRAIREGGQESDGIKHGGDFFNDPTWAGKQGGTKQPGISGKRANGKGDAWFQDGASKHGSKSNARKHASAQIAKIPRVLSRHIAKVYYP